MKKISMLIFLGCSFYFAHGQVDMTRKDSDLKDQRFSLEIAGNYYHFREQITSVLNYRGVGGGEVSLGYQVAKANRSLQRFQLSLGYGEASPAINPEIDGTSIYSIKAAYSILFGLNTNTKRKISWYGGAKATFDGLYIEYPLLFANNGDAYSIDWLSIRPTLRMDYKISDNYPKSTLNLQTQIGLLAWNARPQAYSGISPENIFQDQKITTLHNNLNITNSIVYQLENKKRQQFRLIYRWTFLKNTSTINKLTYAQHSLGVEYSFQTKKSKNR